MEKSSFFNSVSGDRKYKAEDYASYFSSFIGNGIFPNPSTNLQILSNNNMTVTLKSGKAWINGYFYSNTDNLVLSIDVADGVLKRIDRVVVRLDYLNREIKTYVKKGTFASSPVAPTLQRDADIYELGLADVLINNGATSITQVNITDLRLDATKCGIVTGTVEQIDATTLFAQYDAEFTEWFDTVKGSLSGDVAGNLQAQITTVDGKIDTLEDTVTTQLGEMETDIENLQNNKANSTDLENKVDKNNYVANNAFAVTTGTSTAYTVTLNPAPTALVDGMQITILPHIDCGAAPTLKVNTLTALTIVKQDGSAVAAGDIKANKPLSLVRVGSNFFIRSSGGSKPFYQPGDNVQFYVISSSLTTWNTFDTNVFKLRLNVDGTFRLKFTLRPLDGDYYIFADVRVNEVSKIMFSTNNSASAKACSVDLPLKVNDVLSVYVRSSSSDNRAFASGFQLYVASTEYVTPV